ncbi:ABC transporter permease subunit [Sporosarcina oncorhynchi]|uniref:ABC transporter permease subunit n=1 Tax=Sporosarcina oncorhynchi TaxID=3056444 RepID=A0ABZ0L6U2_9BACL|nr:ABC transporter permease subunit [Sporosarcina sp. T2O-4]WOV87783.1 ABC transporter permease subunit [Sporosarcina sp. T2O-4]
MLPLIQFEAIKTVKSTFFKVVLLALTAFIIGYYVFVYMNTTRAEDLLAEADEWLFMTQSQLEELESAAASGQRDKDSKEYKEEKQMLEEFWLPRYMDEVEAYNNKDYNRILEMEIYHRSTTLVQRLAQGDYWSTLWPSLFTDESGFAKLEWMHEKHIQPVWPISVFADLTVHDKHFDDPQVEESIKKFSVRYASDGIHFMEHLTTLLFGVFGAGIFIFLFGDIVTREGLGDNGPIHLLRTQPIRGYQILAGKFIMVLVGTVLLLASISGLALLIGTVFDRFGDMDYPVLIYGENYAFTFIEMSTFLLKSAGLFFMVLVFCYSLLFLFSLLVKKTAVAIGLMLVTLFAGLKWSEQSVASTWAHFQPFHYFSVPKVVTNELALSAGNFAFSFSNGLLVLAVASSIVWAVIIAVSMLQYRYTR